MQISKIEESAWKAFLDSCPNATFFHTPDWYRIWNNYAGYDFEARLFIFKTGHKVLLPLAWRKRMKGGIKEFFSGPIGTYGGIITNDLLKDNEIQELENYFKKISLLEIRSNPLNSILKDSFFTKQSFTQIIDLKRGWELIYKNWSKGHASAAKKGIREGLVIKIAQKEDWKDYFRIYEQTFDRWDKPPDTKYTFELFNELRKLDTQKCKLWLIKKEDKIIAGALCFYFQNHVVYWHGSSLQEYFASKPGQFLQYHIIQHAITEKYEWYDFNPSGNHTSVQKFKKGFGTKMIPSNIYSKKPFLIEKIFELRRKLK